LRIAVGLILHAAGLHHGSAHLGDHVLREAGDLGAGPRSKSKSHQIPPMTAHQFLRYVRSPDLETWRILAE
jgi:hypothetical protein